MKILFAASEAVPFVKTGGLADVCGALPKYLRKLGHDVRLVLPRYWAINREQYNLKSVISPLSVQMGNCNVWCEVLEGAVDEVPVYFIEHENFFGRAGIYDDGRWEYGDNAERFGFFARACIELCRNLNFQPDIIHSHDWQVALIPAYLKIWHLHDPFFEKTASVFTIHNIAYQGVFHSWFYPLLGLGHENFVEPKFENYQCVNFMKGAIFYADCVSTVSPSYANEILSEPGGNGLSQYLGRRREDLVGILNGVDYDNWNPETDRYTPEYYSANDFSGKAIFKRRLQQEFLLEVKGKIPVIGVVSRLTDQKGFQVLAAIIKWIVRNMVVQFVFLGSGEKWMEDFYGGLPAKFPGRIGAWIGYDTRKAHLIEAGSDFFLMPSLFEPCGLNQIYSLKYGTLPIVRETGGLKDTVEQYSETLGTGTGFRFQILDPMSIYYTIGWAVSTYYDRPQHFMAMRKEAMQQNFNWIDSAKKYETLYHKALDRRASWQ